MNNLLSYCGLVDARIRASDKDLPVHTRFYSNQRGKKNRENASVCKLCIEIQVFLSFGR